MMPGARRARPATSLRQPRATAQARLEPPVPAGLRLALAQGSLGMELAGPASIGPIQVRELTVRLEDLKFPLDLAGGVSRFRHRRGRLTMLLAALDLHALARDLEPRLRGQLVAGRPVAATLAGEPHGIAVGLSSGDVALAFDIVVAPLDGDVRVLIEDARGMGLSAPAHVAAARVTALVLKGLGERVGGAFLVRDPLGALARRLLPDLGARAPSTRGLLFSMDDVEATRLAVAGREEGPAAPLTARAIRALEACELAAPGDDAALAGDIDAARSAYLAALERAPKHVELATRLAALDFSAGDRAEAALSTLVDAAGPTNAGLLGSGVLEAVGETEAAYATAARAAADEAYGPLAALGWLRAARLANDPRARLDALDRALVRAPGLGEARWARFRARLASGDLRGALGDAQHLESAASAEARFDTCRRVAQELFERGHLVEAQTWYERALRQKPKSALAVVGLARAIRDLGKTQRALDLFARAIELGGSDPDRDHAPDLELARLLATYADDRPAAVARAAEIPQGSSHAAEARWLEAQWRAALGDAAGAGRAIGRLRAHVEMREATASREQARALAALLREAAALEAGALADPRGAERDLVLAVRIDPSNREAAADLRRLAREAAAVRHEEPRPPTPEPVDEPVDEDIVDEAMVEQLTDRLRANPSDHENANRLALVLEKLGRDMELLALLSGRLDEAAAPDKPALAAARDRVLGRLAATARREGRADEAALYESMMATADGR